MISLHKKNDNTIMIKKDIHILNISFSGLKNVAVYFMLIIFLLKICELIFNFVNPVIEETYFRKCQVKHTWTL